MQGITLSVMLDAMNSVSTLEFFLPPLLIFVPTPSKIAMTFFKFQDYCTQIYKITVSDELNEVLRVRVKSSFAIFDNLTALNLTKAFKE